MRGKKTAWIISFVVLLFTNVFVVGMVMSNEQAYARFTYSPTRPKVNETVKFNASESYSVNGIKSWEWDFGDGAIGTGKIVYHVYVEKGAFNVTLAVVDNKGLTGTIWKLIKVNYPIARFTYSLPSQDPDPIVNQTITFDASGSTPDGGDINSYFWDFGDGTNATGKVVTHAYSWPSLTPLGQNVPYNVTLTVSDTEGLSDTVWKTVAVFPFLRVNPPVWNLPIGSNFTVTVDVVQIINLYSWQFEIDFNPSVLNVTKFYWGTFLKTAGSTTRIGPRINNTAGYVAATEFLFPRPTQEGKGAKGSGTLATITFQVKSVGATLLEFRNEKTILQTVISGTSTDIKHERLDGIFDSRTSNEPPTALFTAQPLVANVKDEISFDASSSHDPDGWLVSYRWDYGDGTIELYMRETLRNINLTATKTHAYTVAGVYTATLTVTDNNGTTATATPKDITIQGHDIAVTTIKSSHVAVKRGVSVTINVTLANYGYPYEESFNVTTYANYTLIERKEVIGLASKTNRTLPFTWNTTDIREGKYFLRANVTTSKENWLDYNPKNNDYVDGIITIAKTNIVDHPFVVGGFAFHVIVESNASLASDFNFNPFEKKINFKVTGENNTVGFSNVTIPIDLLGGPYTVLFDGSPIIPEPQETTNGTHTFLYFTYIHSGIPQLVEIIGQSVATPPIAIFTSSPTRAIAHTPITFNATDSYDPDGTIESYQWDFGDGNITTITDPIITHAYATAGNYTVTLTVKDNKQLTNSTQAQITVIDYPAADFSYSPSTPLIGQTVTFDASASDPKGGIIISYQWDFDDGTTATGKTITHTYIAVGKYSVVLNVTDSEGLWDTETKIVTISIHNIAITDLAATPNTVKIGQRVTLSITVANQGNFTETFHVTAYYDNAPIETRSVTLAFGDSKIITIVWNTTGISPGTYTIKANATVVAEETETDDNTKIGDPVTIQKLGSQLSISASPTTLTVGEITTISGTINITRPGMSVTIQYRLVEGTWSNLETVTTDSQGHFSYNWKPQNAGTYEVKASWQGDPTTLPSESNTQTITVQEQPSTTALLYIVSAVIIIAIAATSFYFLKIKKQKPQQ